MRYQRRDARPTPCPHCAEPRPLMLRPKPAPRKHGCAARKNYPTWKRPGLASLRAAGARGGGRAPGRYPGVRVIRGGSPRATIRLRPRRLHGRDSRIDSVRVRSSARAPAPRSRRCPYRRCGQTWAPTRAPAPRKYYDILPTRCVVRYRSIHNACPNFGHFA